jgi:wyosine [tRNA(Phe)-imidazoG37] synthetase (radical SAM superfamily)
VNYKYIFGPVSSRRFGLSLGIDLSPDEKSCNFDCLYCELSVAKLRSKIENPPKVTDLKSEIKRALIEFPDVDVITITANGEPTLYGDLADLVKETNLIKGEKKLLILSNASTINESKTQRALKDIDIVKLSLDCATKECFKKIDRADESIKIEDIIDGMKIFRSIYGGELVVEILVVKGINDTKEQMRELNLVLNDIKPDRVDLGSIDRPPAYSVEGVSEEELIELSKEFTSLPLHLIYKEKPKDLIDFSKDQIIQTIKMRPQSKLDVKQLFSEDSKNILQELIDKKKVIISDIAGVDFYISTEVKQKRKG